MAKKAEKFKSQVEEIFGSVSNYTETNTKLYKTVWFEIPGGFLAEKLFKLSDLLGTASIEVDGFSREGYCNTCDYGTERGIEIRATNVKF